MHNLNSGDSPVKIAISGGEVFFSLLGDKMSSHYVILGEPVWSAKLLQENIVAGEILVTPKAWRYVQETRYEFHYNEEFRYIRIFGFKNSFELIQRQNEAVLNFNEMEKRLEAESVASVTLFDASIEAYSENLTSRRNESYSCKLRKLTIL